MYILEKFNMNLCAVTGYSIACIACEGDDEPCVLINVEMGFMCMYAMDRWGHSVVWLQREAAEGQLCSSPPSLFSDSLPWWLSPGSSVWSPAAANKPTGDINQRGGVPVSAAATNVHLFR